MKRTFYPTVQKKISRLLFQSPTLVQPHWEYTHSSRGREQKSSGGCSQTQIGWDHRELFLMPGSFSKLLPTLSNIAFLGGGGPRLWFKPETQGIPELEATRLPVFGIQCATEGRGVKESVSWGKGNESVLQKRQCGFWQALQTNSDAWDMEFLNWYYNFCTFFLTTTKAVCASLYAFNYLNDCKSNSQNLKNFTYAKYKLFLPALNRTTLPS